MEVYKPYIYIYIFEFTFKYKYKYRYISISIFISISISIYIYVYFFLFPKAKKQCLSTGKADVFHFNHLSRVKLLLVLGERKAY